LCGFKSRSGYQTAQEVNFDLLFIFGTSQNLTGIDDELYGFGECTGCNSPILQNEFFGKDATRDLLLGSNLKLPVKFHQVLKKGIPKPYGFGFGMFGDYGELKNNAL
jgi:hypothetical protein